MKQNKKELLEENRLLKVELTLANEMYPEQMKMVRDATATMKELIKHYATMMAGVQKDIRDNPLFCYCIPG